MASTGNTYPTVGASVDRASATAWTTPENVVSDNGSDATSAVPTDYLVTSGYGFSIPGGSLIQGVTVRVEASETGSGNSNYIPQLHSDTTPTLIGSAKTAVTVNGATKAISSNGGTSDTWGATLTPAIVNAAGFGVSLWSTDTTNTLAIDFVTIAIEYLEPNTGDLAVTEAGADGSAFAGDVIVAGDLAVTESGADTASFAGTVTDSAISGDLSVTESGADIAAFTGDVTVAGDLAGIDAADTAAFAGDVVVQGGLSATDAPDTAALTGAVLVQGDLAATDGVDSAALTGSVTAFERPSNPTFHGRRAVYSAEPIYILPPIKGRMRINEQRKDRAQMRGQVWLTGKAHCSEAADGMEIRMTTDMMPVYRRNAAAAVLLGL